MTLPAGDLMLILEHWTIVEKPVRVRQWTETRRVAAGEQLRVEFRIQ